MLKSATDAYVIAIRIVLLNFNTNSKLLIKYFVPTILILKIFMNEARFGVKVTI